MWTHSGGRAGRRAALPALALAVVACLVAACGDTSGTPSGTGGSGGPTASASSSPSGAGPPGTATGPAPTSQGSTTSTGAGAGIACDSAIGTAGAPSPGRIVILGVVALPVNQRLQASASGSGNPASKLFAKAGLEVRAGATVDLTVPPALTSRARIGWGRYAAPGTTVHVSCPASTGSAGAPWIDFAGGFYASAPFCLPLTVRTPTASASVRIGIATACRQSGPVH
jgi:hypothetical protein